MYKQILVYKHSCHFTSFNKGYTLQESEHNNPQYLTLSYLFIKPRTEPTGHGSSFYKWMLFEVPTLLRQNTFKDLSQAFFKLF